MSLLQELYPSYGLGYLCKLFGKSRQGWYNQQKEGQKQDLAHILVLKLVGQIREQLPRVGACKLHFMLKLPFKEHGIKLGRDGLYTLLGEHGYLLRYKPRKPYTTNSRHNYKKYPNLIRDLVLTHPGQLWVSDLTYLRLLIGFCYLSIITDAYSHKIIGYCLYPTLHSDGVINALEIAIKQSKKSSSLIHHSDRGTQYCCHEYVRRLESYHITISMTENGDPYENAIAERINGILKHEFDLQKIFASFSQAQQVVDKAVNSYNNIRPHASCDYLTPLEAHQQNGLLKKRWKNKPYIKPVKPNEAL